MRLSGGAEATPDGHVQNSPRGTTLCQRHVQVRISARHDFGRWVCCSGQSGPPMTPALGSGARHAFERGQRKTHSKGWVDWARGAVARTM